MALHLLLTDGDYWACLDQELVFFIPYTFISLLLALLHLFYEWSCILIKTWADFTPLENTIFIGINIIAWYFRINYLHAADEKYTAG